VQARPAAPAPRAVPVNVALCVDQVLFKVALGPKELPGYAKAAGLDLPKFNQCLESGKYAEQIRKEQAEAQKAGVTGTPSFFLGYTEPDGKTVTSERMLVGAQAYPSFKAAIDGLLSSGSGQNNGTK
jgi:predicted DsbA family dithiol-disulfide isomerase